MKTTGVGGERGYDGGKKVKGRKRHFLVDTEGLVLKAKVHVANMVDQEGIKPLLDGAKELFPRLSHLWLDAGYRGQEKGIGWVEQALGWSVELVERPRKPAPEEVLMSWAEELAKEGKIVEVGRSFCHREHFRSSHAAGWWNAPLPGLATTEG